MKKYIFIILAVLLTANINMFAADYEFKVLAFNGAPKVSKSGGSWESLKSNTVLNKDDKIKLGKNSYLGLVHSGGRTVELKKEGTYSVSDLQKIVGKEGSELTKRLAKYVIDEIGSADDLMATDDYHKYMDVTGSVERGLSLAEIQEMKKESDKEKGFMLESGRYIVMISPKKTSVMDTEATFKWYGIKGIGEYKITFYDRFEREVLTETTGDTSITLNLKDNGFEEGRFYFYTVASVEHQSIRSEECAFNILNEDEREMIENDLAELKQELGEEITPIEELMIAAFYEDHKLFNKAEKYYRKVALENPDVDKFQSIYKAFTYKKSRGY